LDDGREFFFLKHRSQRSAAGSRLRDALSAACRYYARAIFADMADDAAAWADKRWLILAALVDDRGVIIADSEKRWPGQPAKRTRCAGWKRRIQAVSKTVLLES
jgi:hypothetical protein